MRAVDYALADACEWVALRVLKFELTFFLSPFSLLSVFLPKYQRFVQAGPVCDTSLLQLRLSAPGGDRPPPLRGAPRPARPIRTLSQC